MTTSIVIAFAGWVVAALVFLYSIYRNHISDRRIKRAEEELAAIKLRGQGPYLVPSKKMVNVVYEGKGESIGAWPITSGNVLCSMRNKVSSEINAGDPVILLVDNLGKDARRIIIAKTDLKNCLITQEPNISSASGLAFLKYDFEPDKFDKPCDIYLDFESSDGFQGQHVYRTIHGEFELVRIKPS